METGPDILGDGSTIITVPLDEGETIYTVVDAVSIYFGAGSYTLIIDGLCAPDCEDKACGDDGCGGSCGTCPGAQICGDSGACLKPAEVCDYHLDCPAHEVCGYWPTDGLNRCSELCLGPKDCDAGELCAKMPGGAHLAYCQDQGPGDAVGSPCTSSETCASGLCVTGACREACVAQSGCEGGMVCRALQTASGLTSVCVPPSGTEAGTSCGNCSSDHCDMLAGADDPLCANLCANQSDCEAGQACYLIDFYPATNPATVPYHPTYDEAMNDALMGCYTVDGSQTGAPDGSPCAANEECLSGTCLPIASDGASYCTRACVATTDCGGGMTCRLTGVNMVSLFLLELDLWEPANYTLVRFCDFPFGAP